MLAASVENIFVTSIGRRLETGVVPTQYIVIISIVRQQSDSDGRKLVSNVGSTLVRSLISAWGSSLNYLYVILLFNVIAFRTASTDSGVATSDGRPVCG